MGVGHVTDIEVRPINTAAGNGIVQVRVGGAEGNQEIGFEPGFGEGVDVNRGITGALQVGDFLLDGFARIFRDFKGVILFSGLQAQAQAQLR